jgi:putative hydrolase of the HAD superfamily
MHKLKAVIFDYGKVLSLPPTQEQWQTLIQCFGTSQEEFQQVYWRNRDGIDRGTLDIITYWKKAGEDCGRQISEAEALELIEHDNRQWTNVSPEMLALARDLRAAGYQTAILSNMERRMLGVMREKLDWLGEFDVQMYSCEIGMVKPDAEIYLECCRRLGCRPEEVLFLDDKKVNTEGAKSIGMQSYVFASGVDPVMMTGESEITAAELRALLLNESQEAALPPSP